MNFKPILALLFSLDIEVSEMKRSTAAKKNHMQRTMSQIFFFKP